MCAFGCCARVDRQANSHCSGASIVEQTKSNHSESALNGNGKFEI